LDSQPIATDRIQFRAFLFDGEDDVTDEAAFVWRISWRGSYRTYAMTIGKSAALAAHLTLGGDHLSVIARRAGIRYRAYADMKVTGINPTRDQVSETIGNNDVLKAILWRESTWRQFDKSGKPLKNKGSTARGVGQVIERYWANNAAIAHHDYFRIAWQWDYSVQAARDIFNYCRQRVIKNFPDAGPTEVTSRTILAYRDGTSKMTAVQNPDANDYVLKIRTLMTEKPWEE
jgi:hypothetical protein